MEGRVPFDGIVFVMHAGVVPRVSLAKYLPSTVTLRPQKGSSETLVRGIPDERDLGV